LISLINHMDIYAFINISMIIENEVNPQRHTQVSFSLQLFARIV
jgi:hypothetical protein